MRAFFRQPSARPQSPASKRKMRGLRLESLERRQLFAADVLQITVENLSDESGLSQTPFWIAVHDGNFDLADAGQPASAFPGLEDLAEEGNVAGVVARFATDGVGNDGVIAAPDGFAGAPVFEPGEIRSQDLMVDDTLQAQYFSFASMVIPSNDAFIANFDPRAFRLFDNTGNFLGSRTIVIYGSQVWDAGTEVNSPTGGAAFSTGGGTSVDELGLITPLSSLDEFVGTGLPTGDTLGKAYGANTPIARITIARAATPSNPIDENGPRVALDASDLLARSVTHEIRVTYSDPSGVDLTSIGTSDIRVTGPLLTQLDVVSVSVDAIAGTTPNEVTATYQLAPASGSFTALDNGTYTVVLLANEVNDTQGQSVSEMLLGDFTVAAPVQLNVTFENLSDVDGLAQTPIWISAHDGNFRIAEAGRSVAGFGGTELLAEEGDVSELVARFAAESTGSGTVIFAPDGFAGAPVFEPGEVVTQTLNVFDPELNRFFSYASMIIPSNDAFIANLDPRDIELFDRFGSFTGARTITIYGQDIWDAGTEVNDPAGGAAFSTGGGASADENGVVHRHEGLDDFIGTGLPTGANLGSAFASMTPIGRITISLSDLPSSPIDNRGPLATADVATASQSGQATHDVRVTYSDASGIDVTSIDVNDIQVLSSTGQELVVVGVTVDTSVGSNSRSVTATYQVAPLDREAFSTFDNGLYFVNVDANEVSDILGNDTGVVALGSFEVLVALEVEVTIENLATDGGLAQTPFWVAIHEGNFEVARANASASGFGGLELIAEEGDASELAQRFAVESGGVATLVTAPSGFAGAPVFEPGEVESSILEVFDTNENRFFSFASMIIPSNDAFIANLNPRAYELFDTNGFFTGKRTITIFGSDIWDAGTEENLVGGGAAFSAVGGTSTDENGVIRRHSGLDEFIGTALPTGENLLSAFSGRTPLARITIDIAGGSSLPIDDRGPNATLLATPVTTAGAISHDIQVTYTDPAGIDLTTIGTSDLVVTGPLGRELRVVSATTDAAPGSNPTSVNVIYTVTTSDDQFTARDNGRYSVNLVGDSVRDSRGQGIDAGSTGVLTVDVGIRLQVEISSLTPIGGLAQTPFWIGFHDGSFEVARGGVAASQFGGLELIAEEGDVSELVARFAAESSGTGAVVASPAGFAGAAVFEPGETASRIVEISNTVDNRYFSFASMVIPSNDAFVANLDSLRYELFDRLGNFTGARQITIYGRDVYDAGTEINNPAGGAAFSTGGGAGVDENGLIRLHEGLDDFIGTGLPTGENLESAFNDFTALATITISLFDPEPEHCSGVSGACSVRSVNLQNSRLSPDVNRDGRVSALDALHIVNFLNQFGTRATISDEAQRFGFEVDVNGDANVTAADALVVINELNRQSTRTPTGEGELTETTDAVFSQFGQLGVSSVTLDDDEADAAFGLLF